MFSAEFVLLVSYYPDLQDVIFLRVGVVKLGSEPCYFLRC